MVLGNPILAIDTDSSTKYRYVDALICLIPVSITQFVENLEREGI